MERPTPRSAAAYVGSNSSPGVFRQGQRFGQRPPPISKLIKDLLRKYPSGQIFKELIQNADDAGAEVVRFYIDNRQHSISSCVNERLAKHQGPALIAFNDAVFTELDWEGIKRLQDSVKAEDPFNVGKYGIGFNSVYHITDVPSIVSGNRIVYLDPQEKIWPGDPGQCYSLSSLIGTDMLMPFSGIEDFDQTKTTGYYPKTLFRFPLRVEKSGLSDNLYTPESLSELINELKDEAKFLLLFLRCVNKVEVYEISQLERNKYELCFQVQVAPNDQHLLTIERTYFKKKLEKQHTSNPFKISIPITSVQKFDIIATEKRGSLTASQTVSWLVANQVGSSEVKTLKAAKVQHVFPWVGVAMELNSSSSGESSVDKASPNNGRVFCFLPMPVEASSVLPVHVNGTFGLNDDRRTIKWPAREIKNDPTVQWNLLLVTDCLPACYNLLLKTAIKSNHVSPELFYRAWPVIDRLKNTHWHPLLKPLFSALFDWECLWANRLGTWVSIKTKFNAPLVTPESEPVPEVIKRVLTKQKRPLCDIPDHVFEAISEFEGETIKVSPPAVCILLQNHIHSYQSEQYEDKLELLRYCLQEESFSKLNDLELLPLASETFKTFSGSPVSYLCSEEFPRKLLPNLDHRLVNLWEIDKDLHDKLKEVATKKGSTVKLKCLSASVLANLLPQCYPPGWENQTIVQLFHGSQDFPLGWCEQFWEWVQHHDLSLFEGKLVVPLVTESSFPNTLTLTRLSANSAIVLIESDGCSSVLIDAFSKLGVHSTCLKHVPYLHHNQRSKYFNSCNPTGVLNAISHSSLAIHNVRMSTVEASQLQRFLASQNVDLSSSQVRILERLRIFQALNQSTPVSLLEASKNSWKRKAVLVPNDFCFSNNNLPSNIVVLSHDSNNRLLLQACKSLVSIPENLVDFLLDILFPMIRKEHCPEDKIDALMVQVLQYFSVLKMDRKGEYFTAQLSKLNFVRVEKHTLDRKCPSELYDCSNHLLKDLFHGSSIFPCTPYDSEELLVPLRECGLHTTASGQKLLEIIIGYACERSEQPQFATRQQFKQAKAVLAYIGSYPDVLNETTRVKQHPPLHSVLPRFSKNWLPVVASFPDDYPKCLTWKGSDSSSYLVSMNNLVLLCKSDDIAAVSSIVGSQMYIVECPSQLIEILGTQIPVENVINHFCHVIVRQKLMDFSQLNAAVHRIYAYLNSNLDLFKARYSTVALCQKKLVWVRRQRKFLSPDQFVLKEHATFQHNLAPFYQVLPESLSEYSELLVHFGVRRELTNSDIVQVLKKIKDDKKCTMVQNSAAWEMVTSILNWLTDHGQTPAKEKLASSDILYVPVETVSAMKDRPQLAKVEEVVYTDLPFLKHFVSTRENTLFIEGKFLPLATLLGVKRLSRHWDISDDAFGDVGPYQSLVSRLRTILEDYKGSLTIIKELIQNADDAGATEVNICYDGRTHSVEPNSLLFPGMGKCHGPALLFHNNAAFKKEDFENITKIAGATKKNKPLKIGRFGVGFCSVYHITDIPSFVSGEWLYIFDPALLFLKDEIGNAAKPGKKLKFTEEIVHHSNQLVPYKELFKFKREQSYQGALFRFPFRTHSDERGISNVCFKKSDMQELLADMKKAGSKLFLFLNNVKKITFSWIDAGDIEPTELFAMKKSTASSIAGRCKIQQITVTEKSLFTSNEYWLTAYEEQKKLLYSGDKSAMHRDGTASVACCLQSSLHYCPQKIEGEMFCYLPLSLQTGLPVHVSANFAVLGDRSGIHASDSDSPTEEVQWNTELCRKLIPSAYFSMLQSLYQLRCSNQIPEDKYKFYYLWPLRHELKTHNPWEHMVTSLYQRIAASNLFYSEPRSSWLELSHSCILSGDILQSSSLTITSAMDCVNGVVNELRLPVIDLTSHYLEHVSEKGTVRAIGEHEFVSIFFKHIDQIPSQIRNEALFHMFRLCAMAAKSKPYLQLRLKTEKCIPHTPDGSRLKKCSEIIDPHAFFASLYDDSDGVFPIDKFHEDSMIHLAMVELGIIQRTLPWEMILQRVKTIPLLYCMEETRLKALQRTSLILRCIEDQLMQKSSSPCHVEQLTKMDFIPVAKRPMNYPKHLKWCGDAESLFQSQKLLQGDQAAQLAGSLVCIAMEGVPEEGGCGPIPYHIARALGIGQDPSCEMVVSHLLQISEMYVAEKKEEALKIIPWVESACQEIYKYFDQKLSQRQISPQELEKLCNSKSIWTGTTFITTSSIAKSWSHRGPYLYGIPYILITMKSLVAALKIQEEFTLDHFLAALEQMYIEHNGQPLLDSDVFKTVQEISGDLLKRKKNTIALSENQVCFLPDVDKIMRKTTELAYNDAPWVEIDQESFFVHQVIQRPVAIQLGITPVRSKVLRSYERSPSVSQSPSDGKPFGQHEDLTQRIRNILRDYPKDITVLKELLQNADDAKAKKMYVILDKRRHGTKRLLTPEWSDLQGPALLIWNDTGMSDKDLEGIQNLGFGSKHSNEDAIGQYGIGFNVVYHLTDCPSFLTNSSTLCILDPHCRYVSVDDKSRPGRQFDNIDDRFWDNFSDMKSTYLRDTGEEFSCLREVQERGTLFRFPLRHSNKLVSKSELVSKNQTRSIGVSPKPLPDWQMEKDIRQWAPKIKETLFFLNNVEEIKFFVISEEKPKVIATHHYKIQFTKTAANERDRFLQKVGEYSDKNREPDIIHYQVSLSELAPQKQQEEWLIQQGIGDIQNPNQQYCNNAKPRHGLAAQIRGQKFVSKVFCFLPLPLESRLPVHVNGNFALDSARSGLWQCRDNVEDSRQKWNLQLIEAIASSYVNFLVSHRALFISPKEVQNYYRLFPLWLVKDKPEREMLTLAQHVFKKLFEQNSPILAIVGTSGHPNQFQWLPLTNSDQPSKQAYFWKRPEKEDEYVALALPPILKKMGIQLTDAPIIIQRHFSDIKAILPIATPEAMFKYYCSHYTLMSEEFPCSIAETKFESVTDFIQFVKYIMQETHLDEVAGTFFKFVECPTGIPLLLTADEKLRKFSDDDKVICSKFAQLFMDCCDRFVHPEMCKLSLVPSYFIEPSEDNWDLISTILKETLPQYLMNERISSLSKHNISIQKLLVPLWRCFYTEKVFQVHLKEIVKEWALLLSKRNELFLCSSPDNLVPVIPPNKSISRFYEEVFQILEISGMPILDIEVVSPSLCNDFCPQIDQPARILQHFCNLSRLDGLQSLQNDKSFEQKVTKLFTYFGAINFAKKPDSLERIKSLELFKNIDNTYTSLTGETYVWPSHLCLSGRNVWIDGIKASTIVFLKSDGAWSKLGPAAALGIDVLSPLSVYTKFIFPYFSQMSDGDRLKHLKHVRDTEELFSTACYDSEAVVKSERQAEALSFMNALKELPCIRKGGTLKTVSAFCDPDVSLFKEFTDIFEYPPKDFSDKKWLKFFRKIGLKMAVTKQEFIDLCKEVANNRQRRNSPKASAALLKHLFDHDQHEWHKDISFLEEVSELEFVCADQVKKYSSIVPAVRRGRPVRSGKDTVYLTSLSRAASREIDHLIWTVMPVVQLPKLFYVSDVTPPWKLKKMREEFYDNISICQTPRCSEVVQNLLNISASGFADFSLFDTYGEDLYRKGKESSLFEAVLKSFDYLASIGSDSEDLARLKGTPCIPVDANGSVSYIERPVLVPPCQVIADSSEMVKKLIPFLNPLPEALYSALPTVLSEIGVMKEIQYDNVRHALQVMHNNDDHLLDPNTIEKLKILLKQLYHWLCRSDSGTFSPGGELLYLPNNHRELVSSTTLLYNDRDHYKDARLNHKFMSLLVKELEERNEYGFCLRDLYSKLPVSVRPHALSSCCEERLSSRCRESQVPLTEFAAKIERGLNRPDFDRIAALIIQTHLSQACTHPDLGKFGNGLAIFHQAVSVKSIRNLEIDVLLKFGHGTKDIGTAVVDFLLESSHDYNTFSLYIDSDADALTLGLFESLTENIVILVARMSDINLQEYPYFFSSAKEAIDILLKAPSPDQLKRLLNKRGMNTAELNIHPGVLDAADVSPKLGQPIPNSWYHRLHSDINNVFRSHEWVGYEDKDNHIVFARIEYRMEKFHDTQEEEYRSDDEEEYELDSYVIMISSEVNEEEERFRQETVTVRVVELYKILRMKQVHGTTEMVLYDPEGTEVHLWDTIKDEKLKSILRRVYKELKQISRIKDREQRRKAIRAMRLKWHPDRCAHPFAKEAFQYMEPQIKLHLDKGLPPEDPEQRKRCESDIYHPFWDKEFKGVDHLVQIGVEAKKIEQETLSKGQSSTIDKAIESECQVKPDQQTAEVWLKQAEYDMEALQVLLRSGLPQLSAHACFMANQVAEKVLRAGMYTLIGLQQLDLKHHKLRIFAEKIEAKSGATGLKEATTYLYHYLDTRYPNQYGPPHRVPSDQYQQQDAYEAKESAEKLLRDIRQLVQQNRRQH